MKHILWAFLFVAIFSFTAVHATVDPLVSEFQTISNSLEKQMIKLHKASMKLDKEDEKILDEDLTDQISEVYNDMVIVKLQLDSIVNQIKEKKQNANSK